MIRTRNLSKGKKFAKERAEENEELADSRKGGVWGERLRGSTAWPAWTL